MPEGGTGRMVLVFGILIAPTAFGRGVLDIVSQLARSISESGSP
ncbi:hypothetical protein [Streptomyces sp. YU58]|nr:hypothetical protein [Streptomyces coralus]WLW54061.1 hypothetical protein QU709_23085 [Streptomyces coralus]